MNPVQFIAKTVAAVVFFGFGVAAGVIAMGAYDVASVVAAGIVTAHPVAPFVFGAIAAAYGFTRT